MCGITGIIHLKGKEACAEKTLQDMTKTLAHRGPDGEGTFLAGSVGLGHRRLSIIDLSEKGKQPMQDNKEEVVITYNGEVYNFQSLRKELEAKGHQFTSNTDTEVILYAYKEWGIDCLEKLDGMFAFCLYDKRTEEVFLVRDRLGIKPLFYTQYDDRFLFGSEIKSILTYPGFPRKVNERGMSSYLSYRYVLGEETLFGDVYKVLPGHYVHITKGKITKKQYWNIPQQGTKNVKASAVRSTLQKAVQQRMISDVPLGAYLSGGLDSSLVVGLMSQTKKKVKTYSIGFEEEGYNEFSYAKEVADMHNTDHHEIMLSTKKYLETMQHLIRFKDEPLGVPNEVPLYLMSKELKKDITVVLSGEGADELFSGYGRLFRSPHDYHKLKWLGWLPALKKKYNGKKFSSKLDHFLYQYTYFPWEEKSKLFGKTLLKATQEDHWLKQIFEETFAHWKGSYYEKIGYVFEKLHLPGLLARVDCTTMATSVEARVPFVDHHLVTLAFQIRTRMKMKWKNLVARVKGLFVSTDHISEELDITKYILREAGKDLLPASVLERKKKGFPVPLDVWFKADFLSLAKETLLGKEAKLLAYFDKKALTSWLAADHAKDKQFGQKVWMLLSLEYWLKEYF